MLEEDDRTAEARDEALLKRKAGKIANRQGRRRGRKGAAPTAIQAPLSFTQTIAEANTRAKKEALGYIAAENLIADNQHILEELNKSAERDKTSRAENTEADDEYAHMQELTSQMVGELERLEKERKDLQRQVVWNLRTRNREIARLQSAATTQEQSQDDSPRTTNATSSQRRPAPVFIPPSDAQLSPRLQQNTTGNPSPRPSPRPSLRPHQTTMGTSPRSSAYSPRMLMGATQQMASPAQSPRMSESSGSPRLLIQPSGTQSSPRRQQMAMGASPQGSAQSPRMLMGQQSPRQASAVSPRMFMGAAQLQQQQ